jgi:N-acetylmuramoyl-L-alanine amidase
VRPSLLFAMMLLAAGALFATVWEFAPDAHGATAPASPSAQQSQVPAIPGSAASAPPVPQATQQQPPAKPTLNLVVLDPGHGGTDSGARGDNGSIEKDIVVVFMRAAKITLEQQGFQVVATRQGDEDPSFDERAAVANAQRDAVVITLHIATTGQASTVRTYYYEFQSSSAATPVAGLVGLGPNSSAAAASALPILPPAAPSIAAGKLVPWEEAQVRYVSASRRFADLMQAEMARSFPGSPALSAAAPERDLRSVEAPAIAVEISSVDASTPQQLDAMSGSLGAAIARAVVAYRAVYEPGDK